LTRIRDEFEPLRALLLAHHPCISLMDSLTEVHNEETHLQDAGLLWISSILAACSSVAHPIAPVPPVSPLVALSVACDMSTGLHCDDCGRDEHVEAFCYRKKKAQKGQARRSSQGTGGSSSEGSERSSTGSETHELIMLIHRLVASTSSRVFGSVTQPSALTCSATTSQPSTLGPGSSPSLGTYHWYLDSGTSFHMTPYSVHLSSLHPSYYHCIIHTADGSPLSVAG
jgi:hypothetical protein